VTLTVPRLVLIGAARRDSGKTLLAREIITRFRGEVPVIALKITVCQGTCPRGEDGCGACSSFDGAFELREETDRTRPKDTSRMLAAGAQRVFWLCATPEGLREGFLRFMAEAGEKALIVCESNSLREHVAPGCFIMLEGTEGPVKESAAKFARYADAAAKGPEGLAERLALSSDGALAVRLLL
jgi:hypothetical protein